MLPPHFRRSQIPVHAAVVAVCVGILPSAHAYLEIPGYDPNRPVRLLDDATPKRLKLSDIWRPPANTAVNDSSSIVFLSESLPILGDLFGSVVQSFQLNLPIPDNSAVGVTSQKTLEGYTAVIQSVQVHLQLASRGDQPMFNGDFHVTLSHGSGYAVLLNRTGRREGSSLGYGDSGFNITLSDSAPADVHNYRLTATGSHSTPLSPNETPAALTGAWQPDGRSADPSQVLPGSPRDAMLSRFVGLDPNGVWTLHVSDLSANGLGQLVDWSLQIAVVPEFSHISLFAGAGLIAFACLRRQHLS